MKIYIKPTISVVYCSIDSAVLAASPNNGSGSAHWGESDSGSITGGSKVMLFILQRVLSKYGYDTLCFSLFNDYLHLLGFIMAAYIQDIHAFR